MITRADLDNAIAECQGRRKPDSATCIKLAAFYTIKQAMFGEEQGYSFAPAPENVVEINSGSEFANIVNGRKQDDVWPVIDELMTTLQIIQPRLYETVMSKFS